MEAIAAKLIPQLLSAWLGDLVETQTRVGTGSSEPDFVIRGQDSTFLIEVKGSDKIPLLEAARRQLERYSESHPGVAMLAVPFMGSKAREYLRSIGLSWMDLSGNATSGAPASAS